jgi:methylase of polypeptide subunit release factors
MKYSYPSIDWQEQSQSHRGLWYSEAQLPAPQEVMLIDDTIKANKAIELARQGIGLLWVGDYQNGRELLRSITRRLDRPPRVGSQKIPTLPAEIFALHRQNQGQKAQILGQILITLTPDFVINLRRGQDVSQACKEVIGEITQPIVMPFKQLLAIVSAHEWRKKKIFVPSLKEQIIPHFGVYSPLRGEYLELAMQAPLPKNHVQAFDIGAGTGVLSILLAKRGFEKVTASDMDPRAIACAHENIQALGLGEKITVLQVDLFPPGRADLVVCNPPWLPAQPSSPIEYAIFDPGSRFLQEFITQLPEHLAIDGQAWLIISDLAEHLGLRTRQELLNMISKAGLVVLEQLQTKPKHPKVQDENDPLHFARVKEVSSLWVLGLQ